MKFNCDVCLDTGWMGDNGAGIKGNVEYEPCQNCKKPNVKTVDLDALVSLPIDWGKLKDKYDNECVEETGYGTTRNPDKRIVFLPDSMFEWFKKQITEAT